MRMIKFISISQGISGFLRVRYIFVKYIKEQMKRTYTSHRPALADMDFPTRTVEICRYS